MTPMITIWSRYELRTRWRSLVVLALLIALSTGTFMAAVAGSRRGRTALDRLNEVTLPATVAVLPNQPDFDWDAIRALPGVEALTTFVVGGFGIDDVPAERQSDVIGFPPADDAVWRSIEQPVVLDGRLPDPTRADEVVVSERFASTWNRPTGSTVTLHLSTPEQVDQSLDGDPGPPAGPTIEATVVGVIRSPWFSDTADARYGFLIPSPGLFAANPDNFLGTTNAQYINALVRLDSGAGGIGRFQERLAQATGRDDIDVWDLGEQANHTRSVTGFEANALLAFALAAAIASVVLVGQSITRYGARTFGEVEVLRTMGLRQRAQSVITALGPTTAAIPGSLIGAVAAVSVAGRFPIGTAAALEPDPGRHIDWTVLGSMVVIVPCAVAIASVVASRRMAGRRVAHRGVRKRTPSAIARLPIPAAIGAHLAFDPGAGRRGVPVRPALAGAIVGIAGVVGALTFSAGVTDATSGYARFGQLYDMAAFFGVNGTDFSPAAETLGHAADDPDVTGVIDSPMDVIDSGKTAISTFAFDPIGDPIDVALLDGRLPSRGNEIALAPRSAEALGVGVGDTIPVTEHDSTGTLTVTGIAFVPISPHNDYATGGWLTREGFDARFTGFKFHLGFIQVAPGADPEAVAERLDPSGMIYQQGPVFPPREQSELREIRRLPLALAAFLAVLALGAVGHMLATTAKVRQRELVVMRALGMTRGQSRLAIVTQSGLVAAVGCLAGIPLGVAVGRTLWRVVADNTPIQFVAPTAWAVVALTPVLAWIAANLLAMWPAHQVASRSVGETLREE